MKKRRRKKKRVKRTKNMKKQYPQDHQTKDRK
jgi:hypothetical protein